MYIYVCMRMKFQEFSLVCSLSTSKCNLIEAKVCLFWLLHFNASCMTKIKALFLYHLLYMFENASKFSIRHVLTYKHVLLTFTFSAHNKVFEFA